MRFAMFAGQERKARAMAIVIEASPKVGPELLAYLEAQGLSPTATQQRNFTLGEGEIFQIVLAFAPVVLTEVLRYLRARDPSGEVPKEREPAALELRIVIDGEKVPLERLARPGEIERIARERDAI